MQQKPRRSMWKSVDPETEAGSKDQRLERWQRKRRLLIIIKPKPEPREGDGKLHRLLSALFWCWKSGWGSLKPAHQGPSTPRPHRRHPFIFMPYCRAVQTRVNNTCSTQSAPTSDRYTLAACLLFFHSSSVLPSVRPLTSLFSSPLWPLSPGLLLRSRPPTCPSPTFRVCTALPNLTENVPYLASGV